MSESKGLFGDYHEMEQYLGKDTRIWLGFHDLTVQTCSW